MPILSLVVTAEQPTPHYANPFSRDQTSRLSRALFTSASIASPIVTVIALVFFKTIPPSVLFAGVGIILQYEVQQIPDSSYVAFLSTAKHIVEYGLPIFLALTQVSPNVPGSLSSIINRVCFALFGAQFMCMNSTICNLFLGDDLTDDSLFSLVSKRCSYRTKERRIADIAFMIISATFLICSYGFPPQLSFLSTIGLVFTGLSTGGYLYEGTLSQRILSTPTAATDQRQLILRNSPKGAFPLLHYLAMLLLKLQFSNI